MSFAEFDIRTWKGNPWSTIADGWMLITAGKQEGWNTMTASWGGFGHLWNRDVAFIFVRPTRHSFGFIEKNDFFTLSFFDESRRDALRICGSVSGRDSDKAALAGITPMPFPSRGGEGGVGFAEAELVLLCRKLHAQDIDPECFVDPGIAENYPKKDWHRLYIGALEKAWTRT